MARRKLLHSPPAIKRKGPEVRRILTLPPERRSPTRQVFKPPLNAPDRKSALRGASRAGGSVKKPPEVRTGRTGPRLGFVPDRFRVHLIIRDEGYASGAPLGCPAFLATAIRGFDARKIRSVNPRPFSNGSTRAVTASTG